MGLEFYKESGKPRYTNLSQSLKKAIDKIGQDYKTREDDLGIKMQQEMRTDLQKTPFEFGGSEISLTPAELFTFFEQNLAGKCRMQEVLKHFPEHVYDLEKNLKRNDYNTDSMLDNAFAVSLGLEASEHFKEYFSFVGQEVMTTHHRYLGVQNDKLGKYKIQDLEKLSNNVNKFFKFVQEKIINENIITDSYLEKFELEPVFKERSKKIGITRISKRTFGQPYFVNY